MKDKRYMMNFETFLASFKKINQRNGFRNSIQKDYILKVMYFTNEHLSAEDITTKVKEEYNLEINITTVYRTMNLLEELDIINSLDVGDGTRRYELNISLHHDHIICTSCNKIVEFTNDSIEELQCEIAKQNNFTLQSHVMLIYGLCEDCRK